VFSFDSDRGWFTDSDDEAVSLEHPLADGRYITLSLARDGVFQSVVHGSSRRWFCVDTLTGPAEDGPGWLCCANLAFPEVWVRLTVLGSLADAAWPAQAGRLGQAVPMVNLLIRRAQIRSNSGV
jgi:hypothetical protein